MTNTFMRGIMKIRQSSVVFAAALIAAVSGPPVLAQQEGVKVHGHWTLDVRNPDGTLAASRDFENALVTSAAVGQGEFALASVLAGTARAINWQIFLTNFSSATPDDWSGRFPAALYSGIMPCRSDYPCVIMDPADTTSDLSSIFDTFRNLKFGVSSDTGAAGDLLPPGVFVKPHALVLVGTANASRDGQIGGVSTSFLPCKVGSLQGEDGCTNYDYRTFSQAFVKDANGTPKPLIVSAGQIIQVRVVISFS